MTTPMIISLISLAIGILTWIVGYCSTHDQILRGIYSLPGFTLTVVSVIAVAFCWRWWLGLIVSLAISAVFVWLYRTM